jgi:hypothetical protein
VLVVLDERNYSLTRLRCLYEIGYTPISWPSSLSFQACTGIQRYRLKVKGMLVEQYVITQEATIEQAMMAFTRVF